jgi:hypothetical protein
VAAESVQLDPAQMEALDDVFGTWEESRVTDAPIESWPQLVAERRIPTA